MKILIVSDRHRKVYNLKKVNRTGKAPGYVYSSGGCRGSEQFIPEWLMESSAFRWCEEIMTFFSA